MVSVHYFFQLLISYWNALNLNILQLNMATGWKVDGNIFFSENKSITSPSISSFEGEKKVTLQVMNKAINATNCWLTLAALQMGKLTLCCSLCYVRGKTQHLQSTLAKNVSLESSRSFKSNFHFIVNTGVCPLDVSSPNSYTEAPTLMWCC